MIFVFLLVALALHLYPIYSLRKSASAFGRRAWVAVAVVLVLLYLATYLRVQQQFGDGFGRSDLLTNWLMGLSLTTFLCAALMSAVFLISDLSNLLASLAPTKAESKVAEESPTDIESYSRRKFTTRFAMLFAGLPFVGSVYGMWKGKYDFTVREVELKYPDLPAAFDGLRIAQFSDFHSGSFDNLKAVERGIDLINAQGADLITFTGDWINEFAEELEPYVPILAKLEAPMGKFGVLGNHDFGGSRADEFRDEEKDQEAIARTQEENLTKLKEKISRTGFELLNNENRQLSRAGQHISLVGVENWGHAPFPQRGDLDKATAYSSEELFRVLLSHDPTHWADKVLPHKHKFHLTMSGHTHGSQVGIERAWLRWAPVQYVYERWAGLYTEREQHLYVNRGFGFIGYAGRVGIPPEITVFKLKRA